MKAKFIFFLLGLICLISCRHFNGFKVDLLTLDYEVLLEIRKEIKEKSPIYLDAYQRLCKEAENALNNSCPSVIDKDSIPPSGDKHDYMSLATYWWPDPEKPDGKPYIRKDGIRNPEGNGNTYDDRRSVKMVEDVTNLTLAWFYSGKICYAEKATEMLEVWFLNADTRMNPHLEFGQAIPGIVEGRGIGIIDTRNYIKVIDAVKLLQTGPAWNERHTKKLQNWFADYLDWLQTSEKGMDERDHDNNHGTWYDVQTAYYASFTGDLAKAEEIINNAKTRRISHQIDSMGRQELELRRTKSFTYSAMNLQGLIYLAELGEMHEIDLWKYSSAEHGSIKAGCDFLLSYIDHMEDWPYSQITPVDWSMLIPLVQECCQEFPEEEYEEYLPILEARINSNDRIIITKL